MIGVIAGDVIGSVYEHERKKSTAFPLFHPLSRFTDDTVLTIATAFAILNDSPYERAYRDFGRRYPNAGYSITFRQWLNSPSPRPYKSFGNGSAMRVAPVGLAFDTIDEVLCEAKRSAAVSHDHVEGIKGAQATALAVFLARSGATKDQIRTEIADQFQYDLSRTIEEIRPGYQWDVSCAGSVPEAIVAFLDSRDVEHAIRLAISLGGDADTQAGIAGGIAHAYYQHIPDTIVHSVRERLPPDFIEVMDAFDRAFPVPRGRQPAMLPRASNADG